MGGMTVEMSAPPEPSRYTPARCIDATQRQLAPSTAAPLAVCRPRRLLRRLVVASPPRVSPRVASCHLVT